MVLDYHGLARQRVAHLRAGAADEASLSGVRAETLKDIVWLTMTTVDLPRPFPFEGRA
jgi:hypothetical protein